jgi:hypothetical protein
MGTREIASRMGAIAGVKSKERVVVKPARKQRRRREERDKQPCLPFSGKPTHDNAKP